MSYGLMVFPLQHTLSTGNGPVLRALNSTYVRPWVTNPWYLRKKKRPSPDADKVKSALDDVADPELPSGDSKRDGGWVNVERLLKHPLLSQVKFKTLEAMAAKTGSSIDPEFELVHEPRGAGMTWWFRRSPERGVSHVMETGFLKPTSLHWKGTVAIHGTTEEAWEKIRNEGISCMGKGLISLGLYAHGAIVAGMNHPSPILVYIDVQKAWKNGIKKQAGDPVDNVFHSGCPNPDRGGGISKLMGSKSHTRARHRSSSRISIDAQLVYGRQRTKREKAAERQRRKRERDRLPIDPMASFTDAPDVAAHYPGPQYLSAPPAPTPRGALSDDSLTPDEAARRDRVRAAARERQRKHRALVKQRKLRELGLDMGNEIMPPVDDVGGGAASAVYRVDAEGNYQPVLPHELHLQQLVAAQPPPPQGEPPFPQGPVAGGQTFATTLLLSFSCAPLLKQHLLRTLNMTNEELASLEPIIAEAWDRWDHARRTGIRYEHPEGFPPGAYPYPPGAGGPPNGPPSTDDFRNRFQRVMTVPAPFQYPPQNGEDANGEAETPSAGSEAIDPHLGAKEEPTKDEP
ncbi:hypothetical protein MIND_01293400 [Mycena indigotica]|uniref:Uncharacterized protein n=1 Tax=Mycena indigotica TaxID=2126181 RepID=A0A8H6S1K8_9AGAR|nr:uncharacterized protein MIND_01293400 [Mycena indigotica]KAF7290535.1 hypothetical protein MIND_01293400 [Mycena indigotica]